MEAAIAVIGMLVCGIVARVVSKLVEDEPNIRCLALFFLACIALYFLIHFTRWAWATPLPFVGTTP
jgi:predicted tellurium resistance membrane protein TerC